MLAELKARSQITIPKTVVSELGLEQGDMFDVVVQDGNLMLVPVVVYPKAKAAELEKLAMGARNSSDALVYNNVEDLISDLHKEI